MKTKILLVFSALFFLTACQAFQDIAGDEQRLYEIRMMSGTSLYSKGKPKLDKDGYYRFEDINKQTYIIKEKLVLFIEPSRVKK